MSELALQILLANLALTAGILAVLVLRKPVRRKFGARLAYALWPLPLVATLATLLPARVVTTTLPAHEPAMALPLGGGMDAPVIADGVLALTPRAVFAIEPGLLLVIVWSVGAFAMLTWLARSQVLFMADVRRGKAGPAVVGFLRPRIVTPSDFEARFDAQERRVILDHETIHLTRQDARINALVALLRCICWYNPLVHVAAHSVRIDQELACDAAVVERHPKARKLYADALLKAELAARPLPLGCYWPAGTEHPLMERIAMLKQTAPGKLRRIAGAATLCLLALGAGLAAWGAIPPDERVVFETPRQSPAPAPLRQIDYAREKPVRVHGKVVAVNLNGSRPTVRVQGVQTNTTTPQDEQLWTVDLTPAPDLPAKAIDLGAAKIGTTVALLGHRFDGACKSNCLLVGRTFRETKSPREQRVLVKGLPDRFDNREAAFVAVKGTISSIVTSGADNIITVRATSVLRGLMPAFTSRETGEWRFTQFNGAAPNNYPFNNPATVGMEAQINGVPEKGADCTTPCPLAFVGADLAKAPDGSPYRKLPPARKAKPDPATDAPGAVAQPIRHARQPASRALQPIRYDPQEAPRLDQSAFVMPGQDRPNRILLTGKSGRVVWSTMPPPRTDADLAQRIDLGRNLMLRGTVTAVDASGDNLMLTIRARSLSASYGAEEKPETNSWRVAVGQIGPSLTTLRNASARLLGEEVSIRGYGLRDDACAPHCQMIARDVTVTSETPIPSPFLPL